MVYSFDGWTLYIFDSNILVLDLHCFKEIIENQHYTCLLKTNYYLWVYNGPVT